MPTARPDVYTIAAGADLYAGMSSSAPPPPPPPPPPPAQSITLTALAGLSATAGGASLGFSAQVTNPTGLPLSFVTEAASGPAPTGGSSSWDTGDLNKAISLAWAAAGTSVIRVRDANNALSNSLSVTVAAAPTPSPPPPAPSPAPTGNITQYLTSDGGTAGDTGNLSAPTRDFWHKRMGHRWKRLPTSGVLFGRGNWLDAAQAEEGSTPFASTGAAATVGQTLTATVTTLVQRWRGNGLNRGFYLNCRGSTWPLDLYGRGDATAGNRPKLTIVTSTNTFVLTAAANANWNKSSYTGAGSKNGFRLVADAQPAILRFDLSSVTGVVASATLTIVVSAFDTGHTGHIVDVFECDPPEIIVPENPTSPVIGLANGYANFNAWKASGNGALVFADDFEAGGWADGASAFTPAATRVFNPDTGTTYARGTISGGGPAGSGTGSANVRKDVSVGINPNGTPDVVMTELFGQYHLYLESDFGTTADTAIKIPAMGVQYGWWNPSGYWQSTTGNGGYRGTGLKLYPADDSNALANNKIEYQGHSIRLLTGVEPTALDEDPYSGWFGIGIYDYNLDQVGPYPAGGPFPYIAIRKEQWYCFDIRVKQNSMSGSQDGLGNYATANGDGIYQAWINGVPAYSKTDYRWRRHADFGVQGMWIDIYHGGADPQPYDAHYRVDRVSLATSYIGPKIVLPSWVPTVGGEVAELTVANGKLANTLRSVAAPYYEGFYTAKVVNDYSGGVVNPYLGAFGATLFEGCGHSAGNDNSVFALEFTLTGASWRRTTNPTPLYGTGTDSTTKNDNANRDPLGLFDLDLGEYTVDGQPCSRHSYGEQNVIGPGEGGAPYGTFIRVLANGVTRGGGGRIAGEVAHKLDFTAATGTMSYARTGTPRNTGDTTPLTLAGAPVWSALVPAQNRIYIENAINGCPVRWFDLASRVYVTGSGTARTDDGDNSNGGMLLHIPSRGLLLMCERITGGVLGIKTMDVTVSQPSWVNTYKTLTNPIPVGTGWSQICWCPHSDRLLVGNVAGDAACAYEVQIPSTLTDNWPSTRVPFGAGQSIRWADGTGYKQWDYNPLTRSINYLGYADADGSLTEKVFVYRPRNT